MAKNIYVKINILLRIYFLKIIQISKLFSGHVGVYYRVSDNNIHLFIFTIININPFATGDAYMRKLFHCL